VGALYDEHAEELRRFLAGVLRNADLANEALQATFAKAAERGHTAHLETLKGWLFRVALHEALALRRRQAVAQKATRQLAWEQNGFEFASDQTLIRRETAEVVRQALQQLPAEQCQVVRMRIYEEKTFAVIAAELNLPLGTVLSRMQLALKKLRQRLQDSAD
jgi:RNA polymerase sigma-70 factor (ECF subfamily)